jgi:hypothetical protein
VAFHEAEDQRLVLSKHRGLNCLTAVGSGDTHVFARFSRFAVGAEVIVLPPGAGFAWPDPPATNDIDELVFDRLEKLQIVRSGLADDLTFLRRVTLNLAARPPTLAEFASFVAGFGPRCEPPGRSTSS